MAQQCQAVRAWSRLLHKACGLVHQAAEGAADGTVDLGCQDCLICLCSCLGRTVQHAVLAHLQEQQQWLVIHAGMHKAFVP